MNCYLCNSTSFKRRTGSVRDNPKLQILECTDCGLVFLSSLDHIQPGFYEESGMHGQTLRPIEDWLKDTEWDDQRRFQMLKSMLVNKKVLDFGCGAGGFLKRAQKLASEVAGVELEKRVREYWGAQIKIHPDVESIDIVDGYDLITAFHVVEHLHEPREMLVQLGKMLKSRGRLVIEVPSSDDALITLYDCSPFQSFTYWSQHLYLFNSETLKKLALQAGLRVVSIQQFQRYPLSNHLYWLSQGKPGGHSKWSFLDSSELTDAYAASLAAVGRCDTLVAHLELNS
ncbi:MAG: class I SAM-dependent methyltransferase [Cyanobacteria bacterium P01_D01_bin.156]